MKRENLQSFARRPKMDQALAQRARLVLECAEGKTNSAVAGTLGISKPTVGKWRSRFLERRLDGLLDQPRSGRPRRVTDADVERVVNLLLKNAPVGAARWSTRSISRRSGLSRSTISRILRRRRDTRTGQESYIAIEGHIRRLGAAESESQLQKSPKLIQQSAEDPHAT